MTYGYTWPVTFYGNAEPVPGPQWQALFAATWPGYRHWYLRDGAAARPDAATCAHMLGTHLPELVPTWRHLTGLAAATGADSGELAARMLALYNPPAYLAGCSQAAVVDPADGQGPALIRNYDYAPQLLERVVSGLSCTGRRLVGMSDCLWGLVDGMNDAGLAVSLAFGGRRSVGTGFGIPLVLRYVLEVCDTAAQARAVLARLPVHMAYNVTVVDRAGGYFTAHLGPDRAPVFLDRAYATNHQEPVDWPAQAEATHSLERAGVLAGLLAGRRTVAELVDRFLAPPLYSTTYELGFGTLYTAVYRPVLGTVTYHWPGSSWAHDVHAFVDGRHDVVLRPAAPVTLR